MGFTNQQWDRLLVTGGGAIAPDSDQRDPEALIGVRLGAYRLSQLIGRGGMANVYLAQRDDGQFEQQVAIKLLHASVVDGGNRQRFRQERQILAGLDHPCIARVFDGGVAADERPYLVMELVPGTAIDQYADDNCLGVEARLQLFLRVVEAVQSAHGQLIVHRDLKPGNILINQHGIPKLLDFGIAQVFESGFGEPSEILDEGLPFLPFTPLYAAPEQLLNRALGITTDIYQLGLLLYLLLAGRHPLDALRGDLPTLSESILNDQALPPSHAPVADSAISGAPGHMRRDLDAIVLRCLEKRPGNRYQCTAELLADVKACLADRSVQAVPIGRLGESGRLLRRNSRLFGVVGGALILIVALSTWYLQQLRQEQQRAADSAGRADAVSAYLTDIIESADPLSGQGSNDLSDVISNSSFELGAATAFQPEAQRELVLLSGKTLINLGRFPAVIDMLLPLVAEFENDPSPPLRYAEYLSLLGYAQYRNGDPALGRRNLEQALSLQEVAADTETVSLAATLQRLGLLERRDSQVQSAYEMVQRGLSILLEELPPGDERIASARNHLGLVLTDLGRYEDAVESFKLAIANHRRRPDGQVSAAMTLSNLADTERLAGQLGAAREHADEAVALMRTAADRNPQLLATALISRGNVLLAGETLQSAIGDYDEARIVYRTTLGSDHPRVAVVTHNLAMALRKADRCEQAIPMYQDAIRIAAAHYADDHPQLAESRRQLAQCRIRAPTNP